SPATDVRLTLDLAGAATVTFSTGCNGTTPPLTCDLGYPMASGGSATYYIYLRPTQTGSVSLTASVTTTSTDLHLADNTAAAETTVNAQPTATATPTPSPTGTVTPTPGPLGPLGLAASPDRVLVGATTIMTWSGIPAPTISDWIG